MRPMCQTTPPLKVTASPRYLEDVREATIRYQALVASGYPRLWIEDQLGADLPPYTRPTGLVSPHLLPGLRWLWESTGQRIATDAHGPGSNRDRAAALGERNGWLPMAAWDEDDAGRLVCYDPGVAQRGVRGRRAEGAELRLRLLAAVLADPFTPLSDLIVALRLPTGAHRVNKGVHYSRLRHDCAFTGYAVMPPYLIAKPWPHPAAREELLALLRAFDARELTPEAADEAATAIINALPDRSARAGDTGDTGDTAATAA